MKKSILSLGKILTKPEQLLVKGSNSIPVGESDGECNQNEQSLISCNTGSEYNCDFDARCNPSTNKCSCIDFDHIDYIIS